jgi:adenosine deaminase
MFFQINEFFQINDYPISINTDDTLLFDTNITKEYQKIKEECGFDILSMINITYTNIEVIFDKEESLKELLRGQVLEFKQKLFSKSITIAAP